MIMDLTIITCTIKMNLGLLAEAHNILNNATSFDIVLFVSAITANFLIGSYFLSGLIDDLKKEFKIDEKLHN